MYGLDIGTGRKKMLGANGLISFESDCCASLIIMMDYVCRLGTLYLLCIYDSLAQVYSPQESFSLSHHESLLDEIYDLYLYSSAVSTTFSTGTSKKLK